MKTAIILHGMPDKESYLDSSRDSQSNSHWFPWLQQQLNVRGILTQTPEMPEPYNPVYEAWKKVFEQFTLNEDTALVGHSCGAGFIVRYLSETPNIKVGKVVLVAPWINPLKEFDVTIFDGLQVDPELVKKTKGVTVFTSTNDERDVIESAAILAEKVQGIKTVEFKNYGHFCLADMKTREFPGLLEEVIQ